MSSGRVQTTDAILALKGASKKGRGSGQQLPPAAGRLSALAAACDAPAYCRGDGGSIRLDLFGMEALCFGKGDGGGGNGGGGGGDSMCWLAAGCVAALSVLLSSRTGGESVPGAALRIQYSSSSVAVTR